MIEKIIEKYNPLIKNKLKINDEQTKKIFEVCKERLSNFTGLNEQEQGIRFERIIKQYLLKKMNNKKSKGTLFEGLFVFTGEIIQFNKKKIDNILTDFNTDPIKKQELLNSGEVKIVDGKPIVIDIKKEWGSGSKNFNFGKPLRIQKVKTIRGIVKDGVDSENKVKYKKLELTLKEEDINKELKFGVVCKFKAIKGKKSNDDLMILYLDAGSEIIYEDTSVNIKAIVNKFYSFTSFEDLKMQGVKEENKFKIFFFKAELINDNSQNMKPSLTVCKVQDLDNFLSEDGELKTIYIKLPYDLSTDFNCEIGSELIIAGQCWNIKGENGESDFFGVTALGVFYDKVKVETKPVENVVEKVISNEE